jgi:non-specific serine/threonine protein kinase
MGAPLVALPLAQEAEAWATEHGDGVILGHARLVLGGCAFVSGDFDLAGRLFQDMADRQRASGSYHSASFMSYFTVGQAEIWSGRPAAGIEIAEKGFALCEASGEQWARTHLDYCLGLGHWVSGDWSAAEAHLLRGLRNAALFHDAIAVALHLEILTSVVVATGRHERAAELFGVKSKVWPLTGGEPQMSFQRLIDAHRESERVTREALGPAFDAAFDRGARAAATLRRALAYALGDPLVDADKHPARGAKTPLTGRERQVAELVAEGMTNQEIAGRLVIALRTAETHVDRVLRKLGFTSRTQLAEWILRERHGR